MRKTMQRVFACYGTDAILWDGEKRAEVKVFFQSVNSKSWQNMESAVHPLGYLPRGQYVCMLPAGTAVEAGHTLTVEGTNYVVCRVEDMPVSPQPVYRWALCTGKGSG